jgi:uncharacterized protein (DUF4415 family)
MREKHTGTGTVKFRLDSAAPPKLTERQAAQLRAGKVDTSDIPSQAGMQWTRPGALVSPGNKLQITLRLDPEVVTFFRSTGRRYQSRINAVLREYVRTNSKGR